MNVYEKSVFLITLFTLQYLRYCYADPDGGEGYYYSIEYEPLHYTPDDEHYPGEISKDAGGDCHYAMDLALVFDSSYTITSDGWKTIKEAAKKLTNSLDVSPDGTHVSILVYSTNVDDYYMFDDNADRRKISNLIDGMNYYGEWSRLDRALSALPHHVFSPFNGARSGVPKVVVIFTDGKLEGPIEKPGTKPDLLKPLAHSIDNLRREDVVIYGVSTGASDNKVFDMIAGGKTRIIDINNIDQLVKSLLSIAIMICKGHEEQNLKKYASSSPAVASAATLTSAINITVTVTSAEPLLATPPVQLPILVGAGRATTSTITLQSNPTNQGPSSVGSPGVSKSQSPSPATISLTMAPSASNSLSFTPANQHTPTTITPTATVSSTPQSQTASTSTASVPAGGSLSLSPSSQTTPATATVEASASSSSTPLIRGSSSTELSIAGASSLSTTQLNQPTSLSQTATTGESSSPTTYSMETTSAAVVSSPSAALSPTLSGVVSSSTGTATAGDSSSAPSGEPSTTSTTLSPTPSSLSISSSTEGAATSASESMTPTSSSQPPSPILATPASESLSTTPSVTETAGTSSITPSNQPVSATAGTFTVTVTVTATPTSQIPASPATTSAAA